jgi:hypothetical protein
MAVILGGTYLSNQQKEAARKELSLSLETSAAFSDIQVRN